MAAVLGHLEVARLLLAGGADPSLAGSEGDTPLTTAAGSSQLEMLRLLLARGTVVDAVQDPHDGSTAFHPTCLSIQAECTEALVRAGCDVGIKNINDRTGWEVAEANGHDALAARLRALEAERARAAQTAAGSEPELGEGLNQELLAWLHRAHILLTRP
jgi:ankyrin repeat protein